MLKLGIYGIINFLFYLCPDALFYFKNLIIFFSLICIIHIGIIISNQNNIKKIIAYSSINHIGLSLLGISLLTKISIISCIIQIISHSFITCGLFIIINYIYIETKTYNLNKIFKIIKLNKLFSFFLFFFLLFNCGIPFSFGFISEFLIIFECIKYNIYLSFLSSTIIIWSTIYFLLLVNNLIFKKNKKKIKRMKNIKILNYFILLILFLIVLILGIYPNLFIKLLNLNIKNIFKKEIKTKIIK